MKVKEYYEGLKDGSVEPIVTPSSTSVKAQDVAPVAPNQIAPAPASQSSIPSRSERENYYEAAERLVYSIGFFAWIIKLDGNAEDGVYPAQKVRRDYFKTDMEFYQETEDRRQACWSDFNNLEKHCRAIGLAPLSVDEKPQLLSYLLELKPEEEGRRRYFRDNLKRARAKSELVSLQEIWQRRRELEQKRGS